MTMTCPSTGLHVHGLLRNVPLLKAAERAPVRTLQRTCWGECKPHSHPVQSRDSSMHTLTLVLSHCQLQSPRPFFF